MSYQQHFFMSTPHRPPEHKPGAFVDVGGTGDCGFRAIAAGLMEWYSMPVLTKGRDELLAPFWDRFDVLFPAHAHQTSVLTPTQRVQQLKKSVPYHQLLIEMAYTLRQIAVDALCANPDQYPGAFVGENEGTSPAMMRKMTTWIDESSLAALSNALHLPITVNVVEGAKSLPHRLQYNVDPGCPSLLIQLEKGHYVPYLREQVLPARPSLTPTIAPAKDDLAFDRSLPDILVMIAQDQKRMHDKFESIREALETQLLLGSKQGGLNKEDLLAIYVKGQQTSDYLQGRPRYAGMESGTQHFFEAIHGHAKKSSTTFITSHDDYVVHELVHAIARAVSIGHMSPDVIYKDNQEADATFTSPAGASNRRLQI